MRTASLIPAALITAMVAAPAVAQSEQHRLSVAETNAKVLVQRGQDFLPAVREMTLEQRDKIVVLDGGDVTVNCDDEQAGRYNETGIYPAPQCGPVVAAAPTPVTTTPAVPVEVVGGTTNWGTVAAITGGVILIALASTIGEDSPRPPPVSP